jgi:hypothetical protein
VTAALGRDPYIAGINERDVLGGNVRLPEHPCVNRAGGGGVGLIGEELACDKRGRDCEKRKLSFHFKTKADGTQNNPNQKLIVMKISSMIVLPVAQTRSGLFRVTGLLR